MRPTRIEVEGFSAFRQRTVVDLDGVDLFALAGPTGAGKSSLIDAMVFALYGSIPRLDKRAVEPIVSLGMAEAKVRLDFTVDGVAHTTVRVVRRRPSGSGASTKEARLERADGTVLAGNEKELSAAVEELLGLRVGEFTTCVVLPQGAFAEFLHAPGNTRQDLLVKLLDLNLYERMAKAARRREQAADTQAEVAETLLAKLAAATPEALAEATNRVAELEALRTEVEAAGPTLDVLRQAEAEANQQATVAEAHADRLAAVAVPDGLHDLGRALAEATELAATRATAEDAAAATADLAEAALAELPSHRELQQVLDQHRLAAGHVEQLAKGRVVATERATTEAVAQQEAAAADAALEAATAAVEQAQWEHRAHDLATTLVAGEPCPVCAQVVAELPGATATGAEVVEAARAVRKQAQAAREAAAKVLRSAERERAEVDAKIATIEQELARLEPVLAEAPSPEAIEAQLEQVAAAEAAEKAARAEVSAARKASSAARKALDELQHAETDARRRFERVRGELVTLDPPPAGDDLVADWDALAGWAGQQVPVHREQASTARAAARAAAEQRASTEAGLGERCTAAGVRVPPGARGGPVQAVAHALAEASSRVTQLEQSLAEAEQHRTAAAEHRTRAEVAHQLALHLSANRFEKWVLDEVLASLVAHATDLLIDLSGGAYSLALDDKSNFAVIDHRNADQVRSARTLSGGETFLASLALALALADQIGELASRGSARLESIFLDEGFGTLDPDRLDTVAAAVEELGSRGRMVGLITHVADLAERVPVRFQVTPGDAGSTVERIDL